MLPGLVGECVWGLVGWASLFGDLFTHRPDSLSFVALWLRLLQAVVQAVFIRYARKSLYMAREVDAKAEGNQLVIALLLANITLFFFFFTAANALPSVYTVTIMHLVQHQLLARKVLQYSLSLVLFCRIRWCSVVLLMEVHEHVFRDYDQARRERSRRRRAGSEKEG